MSYVLQAHTVSVLQGIVVCRRRLGDEPLNTATIADLAGLSPSTTKQALNLLKAEGIVRWIPLRNGRWVLTGKVKLSKPKKGRSFEYMVHAYRLRQLWSRGAGQGCPTRFDLQDIAEEGSRFFDGDLEAAIREGYAALLT